MTMLGNYFTGTRLENVCTLASNVDGARRIILYTMCVCVGERELLGAS